jgi:uracil-DNA glycosylase family 4
MRIRLFHKMPVLPNIDDIAKCENCPLLGSNYVQGEGNTKGFGGKGAFLVGEAPGEFEDREGRPFVGRSGELLRTVLEGLGVDKEVYITNVVKRRPTTPEGKNRKPTNLECRRCGSHLAAELMKHRPQFVITLGSVPLWHFAGQELSVVQFHGLRSKRSSSTFDHEYTLMPTFHPSYVLRTGGPHGKTGDMFVSDLEDFFTHINNSGDN